MVQWRIMNADTDTIESVPSHVLNNQAFLRKNQSWKGNPSHILNAI